ncbi:MAG: 7-carboxy-7-deazaguanine synthase [Chlamydiales bacterium]|jgi:7-carboxy-7-deazaguanine synthase
MEVFASVQGEGSYVGELQVFLRLRGCPMRCVWCDTPGSWSLGAGDRDRARVAAPTGVHVEPGWATPFQAACWIAESEPGEPRTVSVTGGEPLLWPEFLIALSRMVGERPMHLETAGGHPQALERVVDLFRHVSLDLKLPEDLDAPVELNADSSPAAVALPAPEAAPRNADEWRVARRRCLELIADRDACAKLVVSGGRAVRDYDPLLEDLALYAPKVPLVVQPVTPMRGLSAVATGFVTDVAERARELELSTRVLPQVHRLLCVP